MNFTLHQGDCIEVMRAMPDNSVDSIVTDPPYELGFMGKTWDSTGIANSVGMWTEALRVLKPGGHLLAFSGSRTCHRMVCAIEDAGFEVRDQMMWIYGSGFPKSLDVSKSIDKAAGAERETVGVKSVGNGNRKGEGYRHEGDSTGIPVTAPATEAAHQWDGWGTALKPAHEPICMARKPLIGTVAANVLAHGTGALNIDGCRIEGVKGVPASPARKSGGNALAGSVDGSLRKCTGEEDGFNPNVGRWPANVIHDGSAEVLAAFPLAAGQLADAKVDPEGRKTGNVYGAMKRGHEPSADSDNCGTVGFKMKPGARRLDEGSAARFFYCAKASKEDRNEGCESIPAKQYSHDGRETSIDNAYQRNSSNSSNSHPTVKPTDLMAYLCRLVTPPGGTVLDPFMGSGSTGKAAVLEGFNFIGIDLSPEYVAIARARIEYAQRQGHQPSLDLEAA